MNINTQQILLFKNKKSDNPTLSLDHQPPHINRQALDKLHELGWQIRSSAAVKAGSYSFDFDWRKDDHLNAIPQIPPLPAAQLVQLSNKILALIAKTLDIEPTISSALPQLHGFIKRQNSLLMRVEKKELYSICRKIHSASRECLAVIAKLWGYNHPNWLQEALVLIGYCPNSNREQKEGKLIISALSEANSAKHFEQIEPFLKVIQTVSKRAIMCANEQSLTMALSFAPLDLIKMQNYSVESGVEWGFLHHVHVRVPLAIRLTLPRKWRQLEYECYASCHGALCADYLKAISPIFDETKAITGAQRLRMLALSSFKSPAITDDQIFRELEARSFRQIASIQVPLMCPTRAKVPISQHVSEEKLIYFPFAMSGWQILKRDRPPKNPISTLHCAMQRQVEQLVSSPLETAQMAVSPYRAVSNLIFGSEDMCLEIKDFFVEFINEADRFLKCKTDLVENLEALEPDQATLFVADTTCNRLDCFSTWVMICALTAHLYEVQLHLGCMIKLPLRDARDWLNHLEEKLICCGLGKLTSEVDLRFSDGHTHMSLLLNRGRPEAGKLFMVESYTNYCPAIAEGQECSFSGIPKFIGSQIDREDLKLGEKGIKTPVYTYYLGDCL